MIERTGKARYAMPLVVVAVVACIVGLMFYPMAHMELKNLPFAILSLDEGASTPQGQVNVDDALVDKIASAETGAMPHETLPVFWQDWVLPWAPQNYVGLGLRDILFMEAGAWNAGSGPLAVTGLVGACLMVVAAFIPKEQKAS